MGSLNLYSYKARFYSPALGRFLQTDPAGYQDGLNLYAYVGNNPFNRNDPSGLVAAEAGLLIGNLSNEFGATLASFGLGLVPGYDLYQATNDPNASVLDYGIGMLGVVPGLGKGSGLALKYGDDLVDLYRAVNPTELINIQKTNTFTNLYGLEGKYFTTSGEQASTYAREAVNAFGDAPYTIVKTQVPQSILETPGISATIEKGIKAYQLPNEFLFGLKPEILNYSPIP